MTTYTMSLRELENSGLKCSYFVDGKQVTEIPVTGTIKDGSSLEVTLEKRLPKQQMLQELLELNMKPRWDYMSYGLKESSESEWFPIVMKEAYRQHIQDTMRLIKVRSFSKKLNGVEINNIKLTKTNELPSTTHRQTSSGSDL